MIYFVELLRFFAIALVANSHFKGVYPSDILSFGGGFGLALFYMISGYLLANISEKTNFWKWYLKRLIHLYIPLWLIVSSEIIIGYVHLNDVTNLLRSYFFPGMWFTASMVVMYPLYYYFVRNIYSKYSNKAVLWAIASCYALFILMFVYKPKVALFRQYVMTSNL